MPGDVNVSLLDIHDSEIQRIEKVVAALNQKQGTHQNLEKFRLEIIERFQEVGFRVHVTCYTTQVEGMVAYDIDIVERLDGEFDPDQQVWEATHDVLELGEGGVIKSKGGLHVVQGGHKHSHGHGHHHKH